MMSTETMELMWANGKEVENVQMVEYQGRTSILSDGITEGKATLQIYNIRASDSGNYLCYFQDDNFSENAMVQLKVVGSWGLRDPSSVHVHWLVSAATNTVERCQGRGHASCGSTLDADRAGLNAVTTSLILKGSSGEGASCIIRNPLFNQEKTGRISIADQDPAKPQVYCAELWLLREGGCDSLLLVRVSAVNIRHRAGIRSLLLTPGMFLFPLKLFMSPTFTEYFLCTKNCNRQWELGETEAKSPFHCRPLLEGLALDHSLGGDPVRLAADSCRDGLLPVATAKEERERASRKGSAMKGKRMEKDPVYGSRHLYLSSIVGGEKSQAYAEWKMAFFQAADVILDPDTANPMVFISEDRRSLKPADAPRNVPDNPKRFDWYNCVLGCKSFTLGRHFWEVEVGLKKGWYVGVCREDVERKSLVNLAPHSGFWFMGLSYENDYWALTDPRTKLTIANPPRRVGVFLDYETGENFNIGSHCLDHLSSADLSAEFYCY
ncbi:hypothetical protein HPG69_008825 [Diceros bicornis minor]|uniref:Uncharacterized protein n=1 Tax=Diceros bicornis minor TaxID=77932 RepID=A0A7J7FAS3_DICBM|nr:hypothetical protein HPG69_008825 [Diceros bicornis minor]